MRARQMYFSFASKPRPPSQSLPAKPSCYANYRDRAFMTKRAGAALFLAMAALFLIANRAAYKGFFQDDELNNISWTRDIPALEYAKGLLTPRFFDNNFRPVGHFYYRQMSLRYGLDFPKYLPLMHLAHILNVWLVWM